MEATCTDIGTEEKYRPSNVHLLRCVSKNCEVKDRGHGRKTSYYGLQKHDYINNINMYRRLGTKCVYIKVYIPVMCEVMFTERHLATACIVVVMCIVVAVLL